jgi:hypothetical protein
MWSEAEMHHQQCPGRNRPSHIVLDLASTTTIGTGPEPLLREIESWIVYTEEGVDSIPTTHGLSMKRRETAMVNKIIQGPNSR